MHQAYETLGPRYVEVGMPSPRGPYLAQMATLARELSPEHAGIYIEANHHF